ncbi:MAG: T9SS type A sorting domain-containing protein [Gloeobacteraceae cyanobacterium ES-bin-316]|nr:T9SS type A sorting domain-containing protein [Ferruginibacter sp.]
MKIFTKLTLGYLRFYPLVILLITLFSPARSQVRMRANLMILENNVATLMDGNMTNYGAQYSNAIDGNDIWKMSNFGENFGILRSTANLVIERRSLISISDTTYFRMWNVQQRNYRIQVIAENLHTFNLVAFIKDSYLNQEIPLSLNDTSDINFSVNSQPASYAQNRFKLIYRDLNATGGALPVTFTSVQLKRNNNAQVALTWAVENEISIEKYVVEYSSDALHFKDIKEITSTGNSISKTYSIADDRNTATAHFYRIRAISIGGKRQYSAVARLAAAGMQPALNVFPNPVANKRLNIELTALLPGTYQVNMVSINGKQQLLATLHLMAGQTLQTLELPKNMLAGIYRLQVIAPDKSVLMKTITVL